MDIGEWLRSLGLERYEPAFRENEIDDNDPPEVDGRGPERAWRRPWGTAANCWTLLQLSQRHKRRGSPAE